MMRQHQLKNDPTIMLSEAVTKEELEATKISFMEKVDDGNNS